MPDNEQMCKKNIAFKYFLQADYDNPATFIFVTEDWDTCEKLVIFIHGSGLVKAGQWTRR